jgi:hypothetical protein
LLVDHRQTAAGGQFISGMSIPTAVATTVRFAWRETGSERDLGTAFIPEVALPILAKRRDLPLLSSLDESHPSFFGTDDTSRLEAELSQLLAECPADQRDIEAVLTVVRTCRATAGTELCVTLL